MSRRARARHLARELKHADAYAEPQPIDDDEDDNEGNAPDWEPWPHSATESTARRPLEHADH